MTSVSGQPPPMTVEAPRRVLIISLRRVGLGDVLLSTPMIADLHRVFPAARIEMLVSPEATPLLEHQPGLAEAIPYDWGHGLRAARRLRARHYDWVFDLDSKERTVALCLLSRASVRVGASGHWYSRFAYTHGVVDHKLRSEYNARARQRLLEAIGVPTTPTRPRLHLTPDERSTGRELARALGVGDGAVGIHLSSGNRAKEWRVEGFAEVARGLAASGFSPLILHGPGDEGLVARLRSLAPETLVAPALPLRQFLALLATCQAFVSADNGPAHMAQALDVPTITIFGPSRPVRWTPGDLGVVVRAEHVPCLECGHSICPIGHDCMVELSGRTVLDAVLRVLQRSSSVSASSSRSGWPKEADAAG
ncbi:MAG TPA: glycosyltransferase family 9 protein [Gemmatimonadaceae bacterium]|nr:glycosyltransferase family 9 protein [Gemmatimonadaceae bacterium]